MSTTWGFKSLQPHQKSRVLFYECSAFLFGWDLNPKRAKSVKKSKNPNLVPIGEGFGFLLYLDYPNFNSKPILIINFICNKKSTHIYILKNTILKNFFIFTSLLECKVFKMIAEAGHRYVKSAVFSHTTPFV